LKRAVKLKDFKALLSFASTLKKSTQFKHFFRLYPTTLWAKNHKKKNYSKFNFLQKPHTYGQKKFIKYKLDIKPHNAIDKKERQKLFKVNEVHC
jgi:hypothetical protein